MMILAQAAAFIPAVRKKEAEEEEKESENVKCKF
jgi:hypothetical protein